MSDINRALAAVGVPNHCRVGNVVWRAIITPKTSRAEYPCLPVVMLQAGMISDATVTETGPRLWVYDGGMTPYDTTEFNIWTATPEDALRALQAREAQQEELTVAAVVARELAMIQANRALHAVGAEDYLRVDNLVWQATYTSRHADAKMTERSAAARSGYVVGLRAEGERHAVTIATVRGEEVRVEFACLTRPPERLRFARYRGGTDPSAELENRAKHWLPTLGAVAVELETIVRQIHWDCP